MSMSPERDAEVAQVRNVGNPSILAVDLLCPCCGERVTVEHNATKHECGRCGQQWEMEIDLGRISRFGCL